MNKYEKYYEDTMTAVNGLAFTFGALILIGILTILGLLNPIWNWVSIGATLVVSVFYAWVLHDTINDAKMYKRLGELRDSIDNLEEES